MKSFMVARITPNVSIHVAHALKNEKEHMKTVLCQKTNY